MRESVCVCEGERVGRNVRAREEGEEGGRRRYRWRALNVGEVNGWDSDGDGEKTA